ncbi:MAG: hypothetical protein COA73_08380 [Candidatus Hydrogenedentota bacterium]|nr:MAG: hypothetical protein COA73_08380 [Candidatus Hydrogenedentota bacterium]
MGFWSPFGSGGWLGQEPRHNGHRAVREPPLRVFVIADCANVGRENVSNFLNSQNMRFKLSVYIGGIGERKAGCAIGMRWGFRGEEIAALRFATFAMTRERQAWFCGTLARPAGAPSIL